MTGLQVWLPPWSRTKISGRDEACLVSICQQDAASRVSTLNPSPLRRTASVVRNGRRVLDRTDFDSRRRQRTHRRLPARSCTTHPHVHTADTVIASHVGGVHRGLLGRERSAFTRTAETQRSGTLPRQHVATHIRDGHNRVVERSLHMHEPVWDVLALLLLERLF